jgi:hypothetical protein
VIWLEFYCTIEDEQKAVQFGHVTHMVNRGGMVHMITTEGTEHAVVGSVRAIMDGLGAIPSPAPPVAVLRI